MDKHFTTSMVHIKQFNYMNNPILAAFITEFQEKKYKISDYKMNSNQSQCLI